MTEHEMNSSHASHHNHHRSPPHHQQDPPVQADEPSYPNTTISSSTDDDAMMMIMLDEAASSSSCAICGTTEEDVSNLASQVSLQTNATVHCGHQFCNQCLDREFSRKREFPCPICQTLVKRATLTERSLDEMQVERDVSWRRRVLKVFNKTEADFPTLKEYNDYLEQIEDMIYAIVMEEPTAEECKLKLKEYERMHKSEIVLRQAQKADEERGVQDRIAAEQREAERLRRENREDEVAIMRAKRKLKQETTEVLLGEREEVSAELKQAQMMGYRNEIQRQRRGQKTSTQWVSPRVREPAAGWKREPALDRQTYLKRQAAGGGIPTGSIVSHERNWNETTGSLFAAF